ncbi:hypothetical protein ABZU32_28940 [Sphaerisporangium sp. NPDC005288]|uniref:hypothetical protein n=1 Tax=Sphaerisporangium sp. NPDC005288 TaxID=3155114 RepID=UPI0033B46D72
MTDAETGEPGREQGVVRVIADLSEPEYRGADPAVNMRTVAEYITHLHQFIDAIQYAFEIKRVLDSGPVAGADDVIAARHYGLYEQVNVRRMSLNSPLMVDVALGGISSAGALSAVVYLFKNPDKLGQWWPKVQTSWYRGREEAEKAKQSYETLLRYRTEMQELER